VSLLSGLFCSSGAAQDPNSGDTPAAESDSALPPDASVLDRIERLEQELAELKNQTSVQDLKLDDPHTLRVYWKDGVRLDTNDGEFKLKIGGRIQHDWAWFHAEDELEDDVGDQESGTEFRRARIYMSGTLYEVFEFKAQYDFAGGDADFKDVFIGIKETPRLGVGFKVGHFKEPFGLEELTSSNDNPFMERSLTSPFTPGHNSGAMIYRTLGEGSFGWAAGVFRDVDDFGFGQGDDGRYAITSRLSGAVWNRDEGRQVLHLGAAYSHRNPNSNEIRFRERPEAHLATRFVDTGTFTADRENRVGVEAAWVSGPLSIQSEYMHSFVDGEDGVSDVDLNAFYIMASFFLTGEHRPYTVKGSKGGGYFGRVKPKHNFLKDDGMGAWEAAVRYSRVDLNDDGLRGGELNDFTAGVNWYWNANFRTMFNYVLSRVSGVDDPGHGFQTRFQFAF